jgi:hypothetical protein
MHLNRCAFLTVAATALIASTRSALAEREETLGIVPEPELLQARDIAENDLRQVHTLAKHRALLIDLTKIDREYNDLTAAMNAWLTGFGAYIEFSGSKDRQEWLTMGKACIARATAFDDEVQRLRTQAGIANSRGVSFPRISSVLQQVILPRTAPFQNLQNAIEQSTTGQKQVAVDQLKAAAWKKAQAVLTAGEAATAPRATPR